MSESKDLRTRIAKVLHRLYGPSHGVHPWSWDCDPQATRDMYLNDADAVIAELRVAHNRDLVADE